DDLCQSDLHFYKLIAACASSPEARRAPVAETKLLTRLCSRRHPQKRLAVHRWNLDLRSERGLGNGDRHRAVDVVALTLEVRVLADSRDYVEIARRTAVRAGVSLARHSDSRTGIDSRRDFSADAFGLWNIARPSAGRTLAGHFARSVAVLATRRVADDARALSRALTHRARSRRLSRLAGAVTRLARLAPIDLEPDRRFAHCFFKAHRYRVFDVASSRRLRSTARTLAADAAEDLGEDIFEICRAKVGKIKTNASGSSGRRLLRVIAEAIVDLALFWIRQNFKRLGDLFEPLFGLFVAGIDVGMVPPGQPPVGLLDVLGLRRPRYAECLVVVGARHASIQKIDLNGPVGLQLSRPLERSVSLRSRQAGDSRDRAPSEASISLESTCGCLTSCRRHLQSQRR